MPYAVTVHHRARGTRAPLAASHLPRGDLADIAGVYLTFNATSRLEVDDIKLIESLVWPKSGDPSSRVVSGYAFGDHWEGTYCGGYKYLHSGTDYRSRPGQDIFAAAAGVIRRARYNSRTEWGQYNVIDHGDMTTAYQHTDPVVKEGQEVGKGEKIGTTSDIRGPHLHFNLRLKGFDSLAAVGRLPVVTCGGYPAFPSSFVNPENIDWKRPR